MAEYIVDTFSFVSDGLGYNITVYYNDATDTFKIASNRGNIPAIDVPDRQKLPYTQVHESCNDFTRLIFKAQLDFPYVYVEKEPNSSVCGYIEPPVPPPTNTDPALPLIIDATAYPLQTETSVNDGRIAGSVLGTYSMVVVSIRRADSDNILRSVLITNSSGIFEFSNLEAAEYVIRAYTLPGATKAEGDTNITVEPYPFKEIYHFLFCEQRYDKRQIRASIRKRGYSGITNEIKNASIDVAVIDYLEKGDPDEMKFKPVLGSECTISFIADEFFDLQDIYTDDEKRYLLELKYEATGDKIWSGFILPEQSQEPFESKPYPVTFKASDGVKVLEDVPFNISGTRMTFLEGLKFALDKTGVKLGFKTSIDLINYYAGDNSIVEGYGIEVYGRTVVVRPGKHKINNINYTSESSINLYINTGLRVDRNDIIVLQPSNSNPVLYIEGNRSSGKAPDIPVNTMLLAKIVSPYIGDSIVVDNIFYNDATMPYFTDDTLADHTFNTDRFLKEDGDYENCYNVIEALCKQFTAQVKQADGYWVIENIGNKARNSTVLENAYDNDLNLLYKRQPVDLFRGLDCGEENKIVNGAYLTNGAGWKRSEVVWKLGLPQPIVKNGSFERWNNLGAEGWEYGTNGFGGRRSKIDRVFNPTDGSITETENGEYYLFGWAESTPRNYDRIIRSSPVAVFSQEVINVSFQFIGNAKRSIFVDFILQIGNFYCVNVDSRFNAIEPVWRQEYGLFSIQIEDTEQDSGKYPPFGNSTNINFSLPPAPFQGYFTIAIIKQASSARPDYNNIKTAGFDNFKITKTSPISGANIISESTVTVENKSGNYSKVPEPYEVLFGDVDNVFRTDGIKDLSGKATALWKRDSILEAEPLNDLVARELLSQFQNTFKILEGEIIGRNLNIRSVFNLPEYSLYRFATLTGQYNIAECRAKVTIAEVYAEEALNSGAIGGGGGISHGDLGFAPINVLGYGNKMLTDGNNNIFLENGD